MIWLHLFVISRMIHQAKGDREGATRVSSAALADAFGGANRCAQDAT
jgi:hypothetical protein